MNTTLASSHSTAFLVAVAIALPVLPLVASLPSPPMIFSEFNNFAHAPVFGALAVVIYELLRRSSTWRARTRYLLAFVVTLAAGGIDELIQSTLERSAELVDWRTDALGAIAGLAIVALVSSQRRWLSGIVLGVAAGTVLWPVAAASLAYWERSRQFPAVLQITSSLDSYFVWTEGLQSSTSALPARWSRPDDPASLRLRVVNHHHGVTLTEPWPDWSGYTRLMLDLTNAEAQPVTLTLRVHDRVHDNRANDRFNRHITLTAGTRTVLAIPLTEIADSPTDRQLDLSAVAGLIIFGGNQAQSIGQEYYLTRIWLE